MYAVIMAGGGGTRLWPLSRTSRPKPFLPLLEDGGSLLAATVARLAPLVDPDDIYVITDASHVELVRETTPAVPSANIVGEPEGRNTAAAVALAASIIDRPSDEVMLVLPADQVIGDAAGFRAALTSASGRAADGDMVTLGIEPNAPETGYGYVIAVGPAEEVAGRPTFRVERFEEKPSLERAQELIESASAYWNAGIFVWRRDAVQTGLARHAPDIYEPVQAWCQDHLPAPAGQLGWPGPSIAEVYRDVPATSIDYALLEPASAEARVAVVPADIGWSDLGSWSALRQHRGADTSAVLDAEPPASIIDVGSGNVLVHAGGGRTVAVVGLEDVIVVDTPDALLVSSAGDAQRVKDVVDRLREEKRDDLL